MAAQAEPGRLVGGRYRLLARLGSGGMGRVWRASDEALRIEVAVKEVWLPAAPGPDVDERLRRAEREARNAARLRDHPNVVAVHDVVVEDGVPWTVMQLVAGHTLEEHVEQYGPLSVAHAALVAGALLDALEAAHAAGIVHRDVKPANVMLADDGHVLLTDFGIALASADTALTAAGSFLGSVEYIAPERARGTEGMAASDLFSLGVTLFQAVEGFSPFHRETATGTLTAVILDEAPAPVRAGRLTPLITGLLEKDPAARAGIAEARLLVAAARETPPTLVEAPPTVRETKPLVAAQESSEASARRATGAAGSTGQRKQPTAAPRRPGVSPQGTSASRGIGASSHGTGASRGTGVSPQGTGASRGTGTSSRAGTSATSVPPRRPTGPGQRPSQNTDHPRRPAGTGTGIGTGQRPTMPRPHGPAAPARRRRKMRPRGVLLVLLVVATIAGVAIASQRHPAAFSVTTVREGDFVKVDDSGHISGRLPASKARSNADGRRVTARENQPDPDVCTKYHALGRPDVETESSLSFCLVKPLEEAANPDAK